MAATVSNPFSLPSGQIGSDQQMTMCSILQEAVLSLCQANYPETTQLEVDAIICISVLNSAEQHVVKIHEKLNDNFESMYIAQNQNSSNSILGKQAVSGVVDHPEVVKVRSVASPHVDQQAFGQSLTRHNRRISGRTRMANIQKRLSDGVDSFSKRSKIDSPSNQICDIEPVKIKVEPHDDEDNSKASFGLVDDSSGEVSHLEPHPTALYRSDIPVEPPDKNARLPQSSVLLHPSRQTMSGQYPVPGPQSNQFSVGNRNVSSTVTHESELQTLTSAPDATTSHSITDVHMPIIPLDSKAEVQQVASHLDPDISADGSEQNLSQLEMVQGMEEQYLQSLPSNGEDDTEDFEDGQDMKYGEQAEASEFNLTPTRKYRSYSPAALTNAYFAVKKNNMPVRRAAKQYCVPEQTLRDRVKGKIDIGCVTSGAQPTLSSDEEMKLVRHFEMMAANGYRFTRQEILTCATEYAIELGKRRSEKPLTLKWFDTFIKRWPELKAMNLRVPRMTHAESTYTSVITPFFDKIETVINEYNLLDKPNLIFTVGEMQLTENNSPCVEARTQSRSRMLQTGKKRVTTLLASGSASGGTVPPFFVFAGKRMNPELLAGSTTGSAGLVSESGCSNAEIFKKYVEHFLKFIPPRESDQNLLLLDGHKSHISVDLLDWAKEKNIILLVLPADMANILQPLEMLCYGSFQRMYNAEFHKLKQTSTISRYNISSVACKVYSRAFSAENLVSGFCSTGIYPLNKTVFNIKDRLELAETKTSDLKAANQLP